MKELCRILGLDYTEVEKARPRFMSWEDESWGGINWQEIERWGRLVTDN